MLGEKPVAQLCSITKGGLIHQGSDDIIRQNKYAILLVVRYNSLEITKRWQGCKELCSMKGDRRRKEATTDKKTINLGRHRSGITKLVRSQKGGEGSKGNPGNMAGIIFQTSELAQYKLAILWSSLPYCMYR